MFSNLFFKISSTNIMLMFGVFYVMFVVTVREQVRSSCSLKTPSSGDDPKQQPAATEGHDRI